MASITRRTLLNPGKCASRISAQWIAPSSLPCRRTFSSTTHRNRDRDDLPERPPDKEPEYNHHLPRRINRKLEEKFEKTAANQLAALSQQVSDIDLSADAQALKAGKRVFPWHEKEERSFDFDSDYEIPKSRKKLGFWAEGEESMGPDEEYYGDDITSLGHAQLEMHREVRNYARLAAWELPLLNELARPFELPSAATPYRFRYTSYLGEQHPAANKVVVEFCTADIQGLTKQQRDKLIKLAGVRYNPDSDIVKMSCEQFDTQAQNKRFLGETISKLLAEAKDKKDTFADVPFDFRHHKPKVFHKFPEAWKVTPEREKYLAEKRQAELAFYDEKVQKGTLVDGVKEVQTALPFTTPEPVLLPVDGARGKQLR